MVTVRSISKMSLPTIGVNILLKLATFLKVSVIIGTMPAFFSVSSMIMPLSGAFGGTLMSICVCALSVLIKLLIGTQLSFILLAYHIPGLFAALYWANPSFAIRFAVPLFCMIAFIAHPVGGQAWLYTTYWLIPMALYLFKKDSIWFQSLGSTLVAHAVGSAIWIWADPMSASVWLALIPVVFVERLVFACGITLVYVSIKQAKSYLNKLALVKQNRAMRLNCQ